LKDLGVDGSILLKRIFKKWDSDVVWVWFRAGTPGWLLWMRWRTFGFHKLLGFSCLAADLLASQKWFCSVALVTQSVFLRACVCVCVCVWVCVCVCVCVNNQWNTWKHTI
jgi:hypothetical protein